MREGAIVKGIVKGRGLLLNRALPYPKGSEVEIVLRSVKFPTPRKGIKDSHRNGLRWLIKFAEERVPLKNKDKGEWDNIIKIVYKSRTSSRVKDPL